MATNGHHNGSQLSLAGWIRTNLICKCLGEEPSEFIKTRERRESSGIWGLAELPRATMKLLCTRLTRASSTLTIDPTSHEEPNEEPRRILAWRSDELLCFLACISLDALGVFAFKCCFDFAPMLLPVARPEMDEKLETGAQARVAHTLF